MAVDGWETATIQSLIDDGVILAHKDGNYGSSYPRVNEFGNTGVPFLTAKLIDDAGHIDFRSASRLSTTKANELTYGFIQAGDVLLSHNATIGRVAIVPALSEPVLVGTSLTYFRLDPDKLLSRYLAAYFKGRDFQNQLVAVMSHSTRNQVPITAQRRLTVVVPPLPDQRAIADALEVLENKIEVNRRMNRALEGAARATFKAWFIDFDPVKAKKQGAASFPGMPHQVFDQLPERLNDTDQGAVPDGWNVVPIGDLVDVVGGGTPSTKNPTFWDGGDNAFCTPKDMSRLNSPVLLDTERHITQAGVGKISSGHLPVGTVLLSSRAPIGYLVLAATPVSVNQGIIAMKTGAIPNSYVLLWTEANMDVIKSRAVGSTFAEINKRNFRQIPALRPDDATLQAFGDATAPLFEMITANERESAVLARLRDALLPKLISGEVTVTSNGEANHGG